MPRIPLFLIAPCLAAPFALAAAAESIPLAGACMLETARGEPVNTGACELQSTTCTGGTCASTYAWASGFDTVISGPPGAGVRGGTAMNGQEAYAPVALVDSDPRDCIYNAVTDGVFCFVPGDAAAGLAAAHGLSARDGLIALAAGTAAPASGGRKQAEHATAPAGEADLLAPMQGKYRPAPSWDCGEIGMDGGALAIEGVTLYGLESACELRDGRPVGSHGAAIFAADCSGEGETWQEEYILRRDDWGSLAVLSSRSVAVWQACE